MELLELLKIINSQSSQVDVQEQIRIMGLALLDTMKIIAFIQLILAAVLGFFIVKLEYKLDKTNKRVEKLELANGLKKS